MMPQKKKQSTWENPNSGLNIVLGRKVNERHESTRPLPKPKDNRGVPAIQADATRVGRAADRKAPK